MMLEIRKMIIGLDKVLTQYFGHVANLLGRTIIHDTHKPMKLKPKTIPLTHKIRCNPSCSIFVPSL